MNCVLSCWRYCGFSPSPHLSSHNRAGVAVPCQGYVSAEVRMSGSGRSWRAESWLKQRSDCVSQDVECPKKLCRKRKVNCRGIVEVFHIDFVRRSEVG